MKQFIIFIILLLCCFFMLIFIDIYLKVEGKKYRSEFGILEIKQVLEKFRSEYNLPVIEIKEGKLFGYLSSKHRIVYISKSKYSKYELFILLHEFGHYKDDESSFRKIFNKSMWIVGINKIVIMPTIIVIGYCIILNLIEKKNIICIYSMLLLIFYSISIYRIIITLVFELKASYTAICWMTKAGFMKEHTSEYKKIRINYLFACAQQVILTIIWMLLVGFLVWFLSL